MPAKVLVAKPGLDGHDRGAKMVARALRDAGFEVIYTGIRQQPAYIARIAAQEDVDIVGLSILSGAHLSMTKKPIDALRQAGANDVHVIVGGTVPTGDTSKLLAMGVSDVFPTGTTLEELVTRCKALVATSPEV